MWLGWCLVTVFPLPGKTSRLHLPSQVSFFLASSVSPLPSSLSRNIQNFPPSLSRNIQKLFFLALRSSVLSFSPFMAGASQKQGSDQPVDFQGFLNDLQDWELNLKDRDKKMKPSLASDQIGGNGSSVQKNYASDSSRRTVSGGLFDYSRSIDSIGRISNDENAVDATSEKELGNEYFKQKKFAEAIECYSRSIALSPTAVSYANRAMGYIKLKRRGLFFFLFQEAEDDCTEALNLDDRYIKAYSRRATARKELGKFKESMEDSDFALRLEPNNQEIKKQYDEAKSLYEKKLFQKISGDCKASTKSSAKFGRSDIKVNGGGDVSVLRPSQAASAAVQKDKTKVVPLKRDCLSKYVHVFSLVSTSFGQQEDGGGALGTKALPIEEIETISSVAGSKAERQHVKIPQAPAGPGSSSGQVQNRCKTVKQELKPSVHELASRAASRAMAEAAKNITPPTSAYQFEVSWRRFSGDKTLQAHLLKITPPSALPQIFKNALTAPMLIDIIKCISTFFKDDIDMAVKYLENLTKVPRFSMLIISLSTPDKTDLHKMWDEVFCSEATPIEYAEILDNLRSAYCIG
ncbi:unnamed protein product [Linum tenue]|uniref:RNA-polymerase II-associated protein 3-like C-terminal domain-containing protein n=1 Tax=Linum tenue TaxID=586396 RepID=A0AAV0NN22_9ROSI|nr:unnamed protein product [Linum tenue]CAI0459638.1 unnamed protein product [Linum tenue]